MTGTNMDSRRAKLKVEVQKWCTYHLKIQQIPCNMNWSIFQMLQMPWKMRGPISTMQVEVAECWTCHNYRPRKLCCLFRCFFGLDGFASFLSSWPCKASPASWLHGFAFVFTCSPQAKRQLEGNRKNGLNPNKDPNISCWCVPPNTSTTATSTATTATRITEQTRTHN